MNVSVGEAAANAVMKAVDADELAGLAVEAAPPELLLKPPADCNGGQPGGDNGESAHCCTP